ncbi:hypothetical protein Tco_0199972 [Tanacetum coccineum]
MEEGIHGEGVVLRGRHEEDDDDDDGSGVVGMAMVAAMVVAVARVKSFIPSRELFSKKKLFAEFDEFMAMNIEENSESETEEPPFEKIIFNTDYKIKTSLEEHPSDLELKPLPDHLEYVFLE